MEKMKKIMLWFAVIFALVFVFRFFEWRDKQIEIGAEKYEACIKAEYNISPAGYYARNGEYPVCSDSRLNGNY